MPVTPLREVPGWLRQESNQTVVRVDPSDWTRLDVARGTRVQVLIDGALHTGDVVAPLKIDLGERIYAARADVIVRRPRRLFS